MNNMPHFEYYWTNQCVPELKRDCMALVNSGFGSFFTEAFYNAKFIENIYGPSLITVIYVDGVAAGTNVMWRNDLESVKAYQFADTCLLEQYRGRGLFKKLMAYVLEVLGEETLVYGFPNENSYPGCVKMGLHVERLYKTLCLFNNNNKKNAVIEDGYAAWWLKAQNGISYMNKGGEYYLVRKNKNKPIAILLGRVSEATAQMFPKTEGFCLLKGFESKSSIYNKNKSIPLVCNKKWKIPYWKIDAI